MATELKDQKARGAFFTPAQISHFLADWAIRSPHDRVLEPSCGDAAFLISAASRLKKLNAPTTKGHLYGIEIHGPSIIEATRLLKKEGHHADITNGDFFDQKPQANFDAVIGNPPFIRYQSFSGEARAKGLRAALAHGVRLTSLASSWAAFTIHASEFLKDSGRLALVLPAELLSVNYASQVRRFLLSRFSKVSLVLFEQLVFPDALEDVVLLLAEGRGTASHFEVHQSRDANGLATLDQSLRQGFAPLDDEKWTSALIPSDALQTYRHITNSSAFSKLVDWGDTYLGSVTGNNDYFTLSAADLARSGLRHNEVLKISPPGARHLRGLTFSTRAWEGLQKNGARGYLFAPDANKLSKAAVAYIAAGEKRGVPNAYKCRVRDPWWKVPLVDRPDLFFAYMNHDRPRLTTNEAGALILNSLYGVTLHQGRKSLGKALLPIACLNTVTLLGSEIVGRAYGGGLLKHEPREADLLPVPSLETLAQARDDLLSLKPQLAVAMRQNNLIAAVELVDAIILERHLKLDKSQIRQLRNAREALFDRRRNRGKSANGED